jgi:carbon storage regulator CsrA
MTNKNLILTRKVGEKIIVHDSASELQLCTITVTQISNKQCKLGFEANPTIRIDREEVYLKKEDKNANHISQSKKTISKGDN